MEGRRPRAENAVLVALLKHFIPGASDAEIKEIIALRNRKELKPAVESELLKPGASKMIARLAWDKDMPELEKMLEKSIAAAATGGGSSSAPGSSHLAAAVRLPDAAKGKVDAAVELDAMWAKRFIPDTKGCGLSKESHWHFRWKAVYAMRDVYPKSHGVPFDIEDKNSCFKSAMLAAKWLWDVHFEQTKEPCPWDLELAIAG